MWPPSRFAAISSLPQGLPAASAPAYTRLSSTGDAPPPRDAVAPPVSWHTHVAGPRDTVMGLALRYGCSEASIMSANDLPPSGSLAVLGVAAQLRIPATRGVPVQQPAPPQHGATASAEAEEERLGTGDEAAASTGAAAASNGGGGPSGGGLRRRPPTR